MPVGGLRFDFWLLAHNRPLSEEQQASNQEKSKTRAKVEPVFGCWLTSMGGKRVRCIGLERVGRTHSLIQQCPQFLYNETFVVIVLPNLPHLYRAGWAVDEEFATEDGMAPALIYIGAVLGANYTATWFIYFPLFGQVAVGTFIFGLTFTQRDRLHHHGRSWVYGAIAAAAFANVLMSVHLDVPFRIILASFIAIVISEGVDTEIYQKLLAKRWLLRVASSNAVSVPLDTVLFTLIAFWGVLSTTEIISLLVGETLVKYAIGIISALWKRREMEQVTL